MAASCRAAPSAFGAVTLAWSCASGKLLLGVMAWLENSLVLRWRCALLLAVTTGHPHDSAASIPRGDFLLGISLKPRGTSRAPAQCRPRCVQLMIKLCWRTPPINKQVNSGFFTAKKK